MLHLGFSVELTCNPEAPSSSFNLEATIEAKEVNEIYLKAERDNGKTGWSTAYMKVMFRYHDNTS